MKAEGKDIPRWATPLGAKTWERLNELLREGWDVSDILRELAIDESKRRSLQIYARKFGPRRRLEMFARLKDVLLAGAVEMAPEVMQGFGQAAKMAVSPEVKPSTQRQACGLMNELFKTLTQMMRVDEVAEKERRQDDAHSGQQLDATEVARQLLEMYGVKADKGAVDGK